ncbi:toxin-antitoxin system HicB family antitoxin [Aphanothece sacrum]|nr:toxin-antitoxin system HicB family antitoxin [Aphanothece sacrum]
MYKSYNRKITIAATKEGKSINRWMEEVLTKAADTTIYPSSKSIGDR